ncbi:MAG TPA: pyruvate dehydrogenase complex dihydrolipoamide acetyltransferase [Acidisphaera sp.]|nr:pyruvate dehydrogenase complex dihydrolipoamide acetyltransferase [Acidisphaera sp.]
MATNILMPALSPTMTEGTLSRWLKHEGDTVRAGDVIAEIETDKATMEVEAVDEGVIGKILVPDGTAGVKVNEPIAVLVQDGEAMPSSGGAKPAAKPEAQAPKEEAGETREAIPPQPAPVQVGKPSGNGHDREAERHEGGRVFASPLARRMASQAGIDLSGLTGSGPGGRIVRADITRAMGGEARPAPRAAADAVQQVAAAPAAAKASAITAPHRLVPHTNIRRVVARRMQEAKRDVPHFYVSIDVCVDALLSMRTQLDAMAALDGAKVSVNDILIKAAAITLRRVPKVNASWTEEGTVLYDDVDVSVAVSIPDGLITPIVRHADAKGLAAISAEMKDLAARAKDGKLKPHEFQGGGFSISNMGMYGVSSFEAIINPPQAAILAVAAAEPRPVVRDGQLGVATMMTCTLSVDHRVVDGALGAEWLAAFKTVVEQPLTLML